MNRTPGRHSKGMPPSEVVPRRWDPAQKAAAATLDMLEPGWCVMYGQGSRRFFAIALWSTPEPLMVEAPTCEALHRLMRMAELEAEIRSGGFRGGAA